MKPSCSGWALDIEVSRLDFLCAPAYLELWSSVTALGWVITSVVNMDGWVVLSQKMSRQQLKYIKCQTNVIY